MTRLDRYWYGNYAVVQFLRPLSWLFALIVFCRRWLYRLGLFRVVRLPVPVLVVGNITVGGAGKTPVVIWLVDFLKQQGFNPGIVSRGYRGEARHWPQQVRPDSDPVMVGDEAVLLARRCQCPIAVGPDRAAAAQALLKYNRCDVIVADDGLQHYRLGRDIEIAVIDGVHRFGNGYMLPAGPLREPVRRLREVDFVLVNGGSVMRREFALYLEAVGLHNLKDDRRVIAPREFVEKQVHAVAGIGHPQRFFNQLKKLGFSPIEHAFPDHHPFRSDDIDFGDRHPVLMTEKDAVKCRRFAADNCWYLQVDAVADERMKPRLTQLLAKFTRGETDGGE